MFSKLHKGDVYVEVNQEDLADAPADVLHFLENLRNKKRKDTNHNGRKIEADTKPHGKIDELVSLLVHTVRKSVNNGIVDESEISSALVSIVSWLQNEGPDTSSSISNSLGLPFESDAVFIGEPTQGSRQSWVSMGALGASFIPINVRGSDTKVVKPAVPTAVISNSNLEKLERLVSIGVQQRPAKDLGCFLPGHLVPAWVLDELLLLDLPPGYANQQVGQYTNKYCLILSCQ